MGEIYDTMVTFFTEDDWPFDELEESLIVRTGFSGKKGNWRCFARADEERQYFMFYSVLDLKIPEEKRMAIAEYITWANYGLPIGNFELDFRDGEVRYKTSIDVENDRLTTALIKQLVYANVYTMDRYFPGFMEVVYGDTAPRDSIAKIEGWEETPSEPEQPPDALTEV